MTAVSDSLIFREMFSTPEVAQIWADQRRTEYYLQFEAKLASVQARLGIIPKEAEQVIQSVCRFEYIDMERYASDTKQIGYPVLPLVKQLVKLANERDVSNQNLGEWVHWGATTQDVTDTATVLQLRDTCSVVSETLKGIIVALRGLCQKHASTPMAARSNLQQAVPITFGFKLARLLSTFQRHQQRLEEVLRRLLVVEFGGASGTLATLADTGLAMEVQEGLAKELGLGVPEIAWHTERDRIVEIGALFAMLAGTCAKFALDIKLLMQTEVGEVFEPYAAHRGSSSTMPQKRNPISSVYITALAATVKQLSAALFDSLVEDHERSTGPWEIEWIVLPQISTMTHAALVHTQALLEGLEVYPDAMRKNLNLTRGGIVSEAVMMALGKVMGRQKAHDLVYDLCIRLAKTPDKTLLDLLVENPSIKECGLDREALERLCDPENYLGLSKKMVERVLNV
ncbi:hypothetical protein CVT24_005025 [Panaeolus cyanescens]|uniref:Adenylosuccinate lyase C-terminal domain-containing protein n=1 Tax=Panaeolus cyanescens TaxID=181874 RepID=A0A409YBA2_9AGAR|nr:hypothetical protein CVT24_005025 [Panaeolus cyanescens]